MRVIHKRLSVIGGFAVLLVVMLVSAAITRQRLAVQDSNQEWVTHTQKVLLELTTVESLLKDAETGQRGYLYTDEPGYLEPYNAALNQLSAHVDKLGGLVVDNPTQSGRVSELRGLVKAKMDELAMTIALHQSGKREDARSRVLSGRGKRIMDDIRKLTNEISVDERTLENTRLDAVHRSTGALMITLLLTTSLAVIGLVLLAYYILREMAEREKHAKEIREREEWFRVTLSSIGDAVIATDQKGVVTFVNEIAEDLIGIKLSRAQGKPLREVFPIFNEQTRQPAENPVAKVLELGRVM